MYLFHISLHGLIRAKDIELGRDCDTGGQVTYILNLLTTLSHQREIKKVELATRGFNDSNYDDIYSCPREPITSKAQIVRFFDNNPAYLPKEMLWPKLPKLRDEILRYLEAQPALPDVIHAHYADAGWLGAELSKALRIPFIFTGHSLGKTKQQAYRDQGWSDAQLEETFNIGKRIAAEEKALRAADAVIVSTEHERKHQYAAYPQFRRGNSLVLSPGFDPSVIKNRATPVDSDLVDSIHRFLNYPNRPPILVIARPDSKKNLATLVTAYAQHPGLREQANLVIFAGKRNDIREQADEACCVFEELLYLIDKYDLYGHIALPKTHTRAQIADIYAYAARLRGVFVNPALQENFGLTIIEAAANGLPVIATRNGGPADIVKHCDNGIVIDPCQPEEISSAIESVLSDKKQWQRMASRGRTQAKRYSWQAHAERYLKLVKGFRRPHIAFPRSSWMVVSDIDNTLTGDRAAIGGLRDLIKAMQPQVVFAVATGRVFHSALEVIEEWELPLPQALLTSVGSEITYAEPMYIRDRTWQSRLEKRWDAQAIARLLTVCPELKKQPEANQSPYKLSYFVEEKDVRLNFYKRLIRQAGLRVNIIYSHGYYLDILPAKASKALATNYLRRKLLVPEQRVITIGDSGNDYDMLMHSKNAVVVANHHPELAKLADLPHIFFARSAYSAGVIEGIRHFIHLDL